MCGFECFEEGEEGEEVVGCVCGETADLGEVGVGEEGGCACCTCQPELSEGGADVGCIGGSRLAAWYCDKRT